MRLLAVLAAALLLAAPAAASEQHPTLNELENQIMCPVCAGETLAQSDSPAAARVKHYIQGRIAAGDTRSQIKRELVSIYGTRILAAPPRHGFDLLAWVLPLVLILGGAAAMGLLAWRWTRGRDEPQPLESPQRPLDPEIEARVDEELWRFDG
ncbi:MAG: cytochrome c-type biogenesis protein [Gaiellaceae bacterium]